MQEPSFRKCHCDFPHVYPLSLPILYNGFSIECTGLFRSTRMGIDNDPHTMRVLLPVWTGAKLSIAMTMTRWQQC